MARQTIKKTTTKKTITLRPKTSSSGKTTKKTDNIPRAANGQFAPRRV